MAAYKTYLFDCDCSSRGILFKDLVPCCRWCRTPLSEGGVVNYSNEHFANIAKKVKQILIKKGVKMPYCQDHANYFINRCIDCEREDYGALFKKYDIVSRMGKDEQIVISLDGMCMRLVCIKSGGCYKVGDTEYNLQRRYDFIRHGSVSDMPMVKGEN